MTILSNELEKQSSRGVLRKRCSENMQQIYRRTPMPKCDCNFIKIALRHGCSPINLLHVFRTPFPSNFIEIALRHGCSVVNLLHVFRTPFSKNTSGWLLLELLNETSKYLSKHSKNCINENTRL